MSPSARYKWQRRAHHIAVQNAFVVQVLERLWRVRPNNNTAAGAALTPLHLQHGAAGAWQPWYLAELDEVQPERPLIQRPAPAANRAGEVSGQHTTAHLSSLLLSSCDRSPAGMSAPFHSPCSADPPPLRPTAHQTRHTLAVSPSTHTEAQCMLSATCTRPFRSP